jgi:hypothetical protein
MTSTAELQKDYDLTAVPAIVQGSVRLGLLQAIVVLLFALASRFLSGILEVFVCGIILAIGLAAVTVLPGLWTRALTIEGIAGAAGVGLGATGVFLLVDIVLLQNLGIYSNRWYDVGGGSNWWYHPVWWMVGTFLSWMGAWLLANQTARKGRPDAPRALVTALILTFLVGGLAVVFDIPGAGWNLGTFGVAYLPALVLATVVSALGKRRT